LVQIYGYSLIATASGALVASAARADAPGWLDVRSLRLFGKYSYAIYILHMPTKQIAVDTLGPRLDAMLAAQALPTETAFIAVLTTATFAAALVSWVAFERPILAWKEKWAPR